MLSRRSRAAVRATTHLRSCLPEVISSPGAADLLAGVVRVPPQVAAECLVRRREVPALAPARESAVADPETVGGIGGGGSLSAMATPSSRGVIVGNGTGCLGELRLVGVVDVDVEPLWVFNVLPADQDRGEVLAVQARRDHACPGVLRLVVFRDLEANASKGCDGNILRGGGLVMDGGRVLFGSGGEHEPDYPRHPDGPCRPRMPTRANSSAGESVGDRDCLAGRPQDQAVSRPSDFAGR